MSHLGNLIVDALLGVIAIMLFDYSLKGWRGLRYYMLFFLVILAVNVIYVFLLTALLRAGLIPPDKT